MPEKFEGIPQQQEGQEFDTQFPGDRFVKGYLWTKHRSCEGLRDKVMEAMESCLRGKDNPQKGVIQFELLQDGGYEIRYARSK